MNKLKCILLLSGLLGVMPAHAACTYVQSAQASNATAQSTLAAGPITVTAGDLLAIYVNSPNTAAFGAGTLTFTGVSPTLAATAAGNSTAFTFASAPGSGAVSATLSASWTNPTGPYLASFSDSEKRLVSFTNGSTAVSWSSGLTAAVTTSADYFIDQGILAFYVASAAGGSTTVTANTTTAVLNGVYVAEYSGCGAFLGATAGVIAPPGTSANSITTGPMKLSSTPGLIVGMATDYNKNLASTDLTAGTGYTARTAVWSSTAGYGWPEDEVPSSGTSFSTTWSPDSNAQYNTFLSVAMAFASAGTSSCTHAGWSQSGTFTVPNGTSGSYYGKIGNWVTPDCSTVPYWQQQGVFGVN